VRTVRLDVRTGRRLGRGDELEPAESTANPGSARKRKTLRGRIRQTDPAIAKLVGISNPPQPELILRGGDGGEYSVRVEEIEFTRSAFLQRLNQLMGDGSARRSGTRHEVVVERRGSPQANVDWTWRQIVAATPMGEDLVVGWDPRGALVVVLPRASSPGVHQLEIVRLNPVDGRERPLPGTLIRSARLPRGVCPVAVLCTQDGRTIAGGMAEDPTGDGWWIAGW
jgi:hypothetical protein